MAKKLISVRVSSRTNDQIKTLAERLQTSQAEVVARAVEAFYRSEEKGGKA
jgi:predicted transcriptional regulator